MHERWLCCYQAGTDEVMIRFDASPTEMRTPNETVAMIPDDISVLRLSGHYIKSVVEVREEAAIKCKQMRFIDTIPGHDFHLLCPDTYLKLIAPTEERRL